MTFRYSLLVIALALISLPASAQVDQKINTLAGNGGDGFTGDGGNASSATLWGPTEVALDSNRNLYFVDFNNYRVRKVSTAGIITTVAGDGTAGNSNNGSIATTADVNPHGIAFDRRGNLFISDYNDHVIRRVDRNGIITKYAGGGPSAISVHYGYTGDGGKADTCRFNGPLGIAVDDTGNLYVADGGNNVIRRIDTFRNITTFAGTGARGYFGDGALAVFAELDSPYSVVVDHHGNVYINDYGNGVIRVVDNTKTISTYAGTGVPGYFGDGGLAGLAQFNDVRGMGVDTASNLYIADALNNVIRKIDYVTGIIHTAVGNGSAGFMGDRGYVEGCNLFNPYGVVVDKYGSIYIADANNERIRKTYDPTGITTIHGNTQLSVFPNPAGMQFTVSGLEVSEAVTLTDVTGRELQTWTAQSTTQSFDISAYAPGIYLLRTSAAVVKLVKE